MLLCKTFVDNNERDSFIRSRTVANVEKLNIGEKLHKMQAKLTELVDKKVVETLKMTQVRIKKTYSSLLDAKTQKGSGKVQTLKHQNDR